MNTTDNKQAGAVGYVYSELDAFGGERRKCAALQGAHAQTLPNGTPLYTTPPAAVPVEALEGLVAELRNEAAAIAKPYGFVTEHVIGKAEGLESCAERIEQLIKERSNG